MDGTALSSPGTIPLFPGQTASAEVKKERPCKPAPGTVTPRRETPVERATAKRLDRTMAYYEHTAPAAHPAELRWRHQHWQGKREIVTKALEGSGMRPADLHNFCNCGAAAAAEWSESLQRRRLTAFYCHSRHCEPCARSKANKIAANLTTKIQNAPRGNFRFCTFTLKHSDAPLVDQIKRLYASFKKLRAKKEWKTSQEGGAVILEVKHNGRQWHPHLHVISQGKFLKVDRLRTLWHEVTGDSYIVDIRLIDRGRDAAAYVSKYITKSTNAAVWNHPDRAQEWIIASKGLRTCNTFGTWRKYPLTKCPIKAKDWQREDSLIRLMHRDNAGDIVARHILQNLRPPGQMLETRLEGDEVQEDPGQSHHTDDEPPI